MSGGVHPAIPITLIVTALIVILILGLLDRMDRRAMTMTANSYPEAIVKGWISGCAALIVIAIMFTVLLGALWLVVEVLP